MNRSGMNTKKEKGVG